MDDTLEATRQKWLKEQLALAAQVDVPIDDWADAAVVAESDQHFLVALPARTTKDGDGDDDQTPTTTTIARYYGGVDVSFPAHESDPSVAVYVVVDSTENNKVVYQDAEYFDLTMPYIPSFLAFREIDPIERLVKKQMEMAPHVTPAAILVDGNGILHPRRAGIACFVGTRTGIPTIGIGKTLYCEGGLTHELVERGVARALQRASHALPTLATAAETNKTERILFAKQAIGAMHDAEPNNGEDETSTSDTIDERACVQAMAPYCRGLAVPLDVQKQNTDDDDNAGDKEPIILACALVGHGGRVKGHAAAPGGTKNAIFVSAGHGLSLRQAVEITASLSQARIPEPVRQADLRGRDLMRAKERKGGGEAS